jgi:hypothetical protein
VALETLYGGDAAAFLSDLTATLRDREILDKRGALKSWLEAVLEGFDPALVLKLAAAPTELALFVQTLREVRDRVEVRPALKLFAPDEVPPSAAEFEGGNPSPETFARLARALVREGRARDLVPFVKNLYHRSLSSLAARVLRLEEPWLEAVVLPEDMGGLVFVTNLFEDDQVYFQWTWIEPGETLGYSVQPGDPGERCRLVISAGTSSVALSFVDEPPAQHLLESCASFLRDVARAARCVYVTDDGRREDFSAGQRA